MKTEPFVIEKILDAPVSKVWHALTDNAEMKKWYFDLPDFKAQPGFKFQFTGGPSPEKQYLHLCEVTEVNPLKKLSYSWKYDGYAGNSLVTFELSDEGNKTRIKLTHAGLETFPSDNPDFAAENFAEGWTQIITTSLKDFVEKLTTSPL